MNDNDRKMAKKIIFKKLNNTTGRHIMSSSLSATTTTAVATTVKLNPLEKLAFVCGRTVSPSTVKKPMTLDEEISCYIKAAKSANNFQQFWADAIINYLVYLISYVEQMLYQLHQ